MLFKWHVKYWNSPKKMSIHTLWDWPLLHHREFTTRQQNVYVICLSNGHNPPYLQVRAVYVQKRRPNSGIRKWRVLPPYGLKITQTRRSMFSACTTFSVYELRAATDSPPVRVTCVPCTSTSALPTVAASLCFKNPIVTCSACRARYMCVVCALPMLTRHFLIQLSNKHPELRQTSALTTPNSVWNQRTFTAPARRASENTVRASQLQFTDQHPTTVEIDSRSTHLHALTTGKLVRTPYVSSACKYCPRRLSWQLNGDRTL